MNKANKEPVIMHDLVFAEGFEPLDNTAACFYTKNAFNEVDILIRAKTTLKGPFSGAIIGYIPVGFQPSKVVSFSSMMEEFTASVEVHPGRNTIQIWSSASNANGVNIRLCGYLHYVAER